MSDVRTTLVTYKEFTDIDFVPPATFFFQNASGDYIFIHTRERAKAQAYADEHYGKGKYTVKASKLQKGNGNISCTGTQTRKGQKKY